jgi:hypothetical protein
MVKIDEHTDSGSLLTAHKHILAILRTGVTWEDSYRWSCWYILARPFSNAWKDCVIQNVWYNSSQRFVDLPAGKMLYHVPCLLQRIVLFSDSPPTSSCISFFLVWCLHVLLLLWCCTDVCIHLASSKEILISVPAARRLVPVSRRMGSKQQVGMTANWHQSLLRYTHLQSIFCGRSHIQ